MKQIRCSRAMAEHCTKPASYLCISCRKEELWVECFVACGWVSVPIPPLEVVHGYKKQSFPGSTSLLKGVLARVILIDSWEFPLLQVSSSSQRCSPTNSSSPCFPSSPSLCLRHTGLCWIYDVKIEQNYAFPESPKLNC